MKASMGISFFALLASFSCHSGDYESLIEIEKNIHSYIKSSVQKDSGNADIHIDVSSIDKRLKLAKCDQDKLTIFSPYKRSVLQSSTVAVKCRGPVSWSFFVPIDIKLLKEVVVTRRHIPRNHVFTKGDLKLIKVDANKLRQGFYVSTKDIIGKLSKRIMIRNRIINPVNLELATIIQKGDFINLTASDEDIKVSVKGIALKGGRLGDYISVKNLTSERIIEAEVIGKKEVLIKL